MASVWLAPLFFRHARAEASTGIVLLRARNVPACTPRASTRWTSGLRFAAMEPPPARSSLLGAPEEDFLPYGVATHPNRWITGSGRATFRDEQPRPFGVTPYLRV
jgi:hypothetical protein